MDSSTEQSPGSQLCREESWERVHYPVQDFQSPIRGCRSPRTRDTLYLSLKDQLHSRYSSLKEGCITRFALFKQLGRNPSPYRNYFFWSKAVVLILLMNVLFSTATHGAVVKLLQHVLGTDYSTVPVALSCGISLVLFPIFGHLSDTHFRRHSVVMASIWSAWIGFAILGVSFSVQSYSSVLSIANRYAILPVVIVMLSVSQVCFLSNVIPFALDQLQGASHVHYSSLFSWWYWTLNVGVALVHGPEYCSDKLELRILIHVEVALVCLTTILILDILLKHWLVIEPRPPHGQGNPLLQVCKVLRYALRPPPNQRIPSAVQHELDLSRRNRLERAKKRFGGKFETEQVEDTRTFIYVIFLFVSLGLLLIPYFGVLNTISLVKDHFSDDMQDFVFHGDRCDLELSQLAAVRPILLLALVPILDLLVVPLLRCTALHPSILKRLGAGAVFTLLSTLSLLALETVVFGTESSGKVCVLSKTGETQLERGEFSSYWLILPTALLTVAEVFLFIPGFEFICAQAPYNMRSLLVGIFFSIQNLASLLSQLLRYLFAKIPVETDALQSFHAYVHTCSFWFYLCLSVLCTVAVGLYWVTTCKYRKRKRDDMFNEVAMIEEYYSTGRIHSSHWTY